MIFQKSSLPWILMQPPQQVNEQSESQQLEKLIQDNVIQEKLMSRLVLAASQPTASNKRLHDTVPTKAKRSKPSNGDMPKLCVLDLYNLSHVSDDFKKWREAKQEKIVFPETHLFFTILSDGVPIHTEHLDYSKTLAEAMKSLNTRLLKSTLHF